MSEAQCHHAGDAAGWVLGTLSPEEARRFEHHLAGCVDCGLLVMRLRESVELLRDAATDVAPPPEIRESLMATVRAEASLFAAAQAPDAGVDEVVRPRRRHRALLAVGGAALLALGAVAGSVLTRDDLGGDRAVEQRYAGSVTANGGGPRAKAAVVVKAGIARLVLSDVATPPKGRVYQAWVVRRPSVATPTGSLFSVPRSGDTEVALPDLRDVERVIVSAEPPQGSRTPTPPPVAEVLLGR